MLTTRQLSSPSTGLESSMHRESQTESTTEYFLQRNKVLSAYTIFVHVGELEMEVLCEHETRCRICSQRFDGGYDHPMNVQ